MEEGVQTTDFQSLLVFASLVYIGLYSNNFLNLIVKNPKYLSMNQNIFNLNIKINLQMKKNINFILIFLLLIGCNNNSEIENKKLTYLADKIPDLEPIEFKKDLVQTNQLIHRGVFSPDFEEYYYTISDTSFEHFDVYCIRKINGKWSDPKKAFFNSNYNEHGMSFSSDGKSLFFSSTRPTHKAGIQSTWHIWKSQKVNGEWSEAKFLDIPNLRDKLVSHPSVANEGTLYFHVSNLDYSEMDIYYSKLKKGKYQNAEKVEIPQELETGKCTPFISPKGDYILFASIGEQLDLMISHNNGKDGWTKAQKLSKNINKFGQGNPYVTSDNQFLFFASGEHSTKNWSIKWVNFEYVLENN